MVNVMEKESFTSMMEVIMKDIGKMMACLDSQD